MLRDEVLRARRYPVTFAIEYRQGSQPGWHSGVTQNVSASGVLFTGAEADPSLQVQVRLDMRLIMPPKAASQSATCVLCTGRVTRIVEPGIDGHPHAVAATIIRYRLVRGDRSAGNRNPLPEGSG
jgi:hypothetical protein